MDRISYIQYSNVSTYFSIAEESYRNAEQYSQRISEYSNQYDSFDEDTLFIVNQLEEKEYKSVLMYVIFAALTVEALINKFLFLQLRKEKISKRLFDHIDTKMSTPDKWGIATQLIAPHDLQKSLLGYGHQPMQDISKLFALRNSLVHSKQANLNISIFSPKEGLTLNEKTEKPTPYNITFENTKNYLETVRKLMKILQELDPTITSDWLTEDDWATVIVADKYEGFHFKNIQGSS